MLFPTLDFALFFLPVFVLAWGLHRHPVARKLVLLVASFMFYGYWHWGLAALLAANSVFGHWAARWIAAGDERTGGWRLGCAVMVQLLLLATFKYADFFLDGLRMALAALGVERDLPLLGFILPIGISFYTFQTIAYLVDVRRQRVAPSSSIIDSVLFFSFFPQLVAGPILRAELFLAELQRRPDIRQIDLATGLALITFGMVKKTVIAATLAVELVDPVFLDPGAHGRWEIIAAIYGYAVQIYCDFSAYSDMAIGLAALLGFRFPPNFAQPYRAASLAEFWRRWHISLSSWLRDYLYIPLGGNRNGAKRAMLNRLITMLLGGLWHGAAWNFVLWGAIHGVALAVERGLAHVPWPNGRWQHWVGVLLTFHVVCLAWVPFRADSLATAGAVLGGVIGDQPAAGLLTPWVLGWIGIGLALHALPAGLMVRLRGWIADLSPVEAGLLFGLALAIIDALGLPGVAPFIYFQF